MCILSPNPTAEVLEGHYELCLSAPEENETSQKIPAYCRAPGYKWPPEMNFGKVLAIPANSKAICRGLLYAYLPCQGHSTSLLGMPKLLAARFAVPAAVLLQVFLKNKGKGNNLPSSQDIRKASKEKDFWKSLSWELLLCIF